MEVNGLPGIEDNEEAPHQQAVADPGQGGNDALDGHELAGRLRAKFGSALREGPYPKDKARDGLGQVATTSRFNNSNFFDN